LTAHFIDFPLEFDHTQLTPHRGTVEARQVMVPSAQSRFARAQRGDGAGAFYRRPHPRDNVLQTAYFVAHPYARHGLRDCEYRFKDSFAQKRRRGKRAGVLCGKIGSERPSPRIDVNVVNCQRFAAAQAIQQFFADEIGNRIRWRKASLVAAPLIVEARQCRLVY
jgi:hypothetical protein